MELYRWLPPDAVKLVLVLFLSFLVGLEREEHKTSAGAYSFGGVRTFPLIGLLGYSIALLSGAQLMPAWWIPVKLPVKHANRRSRVCRR